MTDAEPSNQKGPIMTDYMQKAREALAPCATWDEELTLIAHTLEALDAALEDAALWKQSEQTASDQFDKMAARATLAQAIRAMIDKEATMEGVGG
jgi:hypothetical protein